MTIKILSVFMVLIGALFLFLSFLPAKKIANVSGQLRRKWIVILYLMGFFILGYLFFDIILIFSLPFPVEFVTGGVFLGGAFFVYIVINISETTISNQQKAEEAIALAKNDWENTFDTVTDMITVQDMDFNIIRANPAAKTILGLQLQAGTPSEKCFRAYHGTEEQPSRCGSYQVLQTGTPSTFELFEPYLNRHLEVRAMPRFGSDAQMVGLIHVVRDITERKQADKLLVESEQRYRDLSIIDELTQLYNFRHFYFQLKIELDRANRYEQPLTLLMLDLDDFKVFNDTYGHVEGDQVLWRFGQVIKRCLRETDFAYRYGGEEFTILLPMTKSVDGAVIAERIRTEFKKEVFSPAPCHDIHMTVSIGLAQYKTQEDIKAFVHRADQLMYQGKKNGKDIVCCA